MGVDTSHPVRSSMHTIPGRGSSFERHGSKNSSFSWPFGRERPPVRLSLRSPLAPLRALDLQALSDTGRGRVEEPHLSAYKGADDRETQKFHRGLLSWFSMLRADV
ncbi:hypothetical protein KM043_010606 [Ampulex compressa]|nr:hypothetical protein KM043_010606 [Ampulex compressa]